MLYTIFCSPAALAVAGALLAYCKAMIVCCWIVSSSAPLRMAATSVGTLPLRKRLLIAVTLPVILFLLPLYMMTRGSQPTQEDLK